MSAGWPRVLMIGLDAGDPELIERWMADGSLPSLARLRATGAYGRLASSADWLVGSPWPTFYTGTRPGDHGFYHYLAWRGARMQHARPTPDYLPLTPFWRTLSREGPRVVALDVPCTYAPDPPFNGIEISGWATHDALVPPYAYPRAVAAWVRRQGGRPPRTDEEYTAQPVRRLLELRDEQSEAVRRLGDLATALLAREPWDLFVMAFGGTHRCGHKLWDESGVTGARDASERAQFADALRVVYRACDTAIGRILDAAGAGATVLVFSLHGMGPNVCRTDLLPEMLRRVLTGDASPASAPGRRGGLARLRELVPNQWRHAVKQRLPLAVQDRLTAFWRTRKTAWSRTPAFPLVADLQGYVRVNLRGREAAGVVEPGADQAALCEEIVEGLSTFVDADTGAPIVRGAARCAALYPGGARLSELPDLTVQWAPTPVSAQRAIVSPRFGAIALPAPGINPNGRSGNHRPEGFLIAAGPGFQAGSVIEGAHILDLAPTVYARLGLPAPEAMRGRSL